MLKYFKIGKYGLAALASIVCSVVLRFVLLAQGWPATNSDEATMGLMARNIAYRGQLPIFFYGQHYMGALEAYIAAAAFRLSGSSLFSLRAGLVLLFTLFLLSTYLLTSLLYSKAWALIVVILSGLGSSFVLTRELSAIGGYPETLLFGSLAFLIASKLALGYEPRLPLRKRRYAGYAAWGLVVGLGLWSDLLIAPFALCSALLLLVCCWHEVFGIRVGVCALFGLIVGGFPLLYYNLSAAPGEDSLSVLWQIQHSSNGYIAAHWGQQIFGTLQVSIPMMTGNPFCSVPERLEPGMMSSLSCTIVRTGWGVSYMLLFILALVMATRAVVESYRVETIPRGCRWPPKTPFLSGGQRQPRGIVSTRVEGEWQAFVIASARLLLLGSAFITLLLYTMGESPVEWPGSRARYLIGLLIAAPAILWPLWCGINAARWPQVADAWKLLFKRDWSKAQHVLLWLSSCGGWVTAINWPRVATAACPCRLRCRRKCTFCAMRRRQGQAAVATRGVLFAITTLLVLGTVNTFEELPALQRANQRQQALIDHLVRIGATHIYSDYWTCDRLAFVSNERIICGVVEQDLRRSKNFNRDAAYYPIVSTDPRASYVFSIHTPISPLAQQTKLAPDKYKRSTFDQYIIYQPLA